MIEILHVKPTPDTPEIILNITGELAIKGISVPENTIEFYTPVFEWIEEYIANAPTTTTLQLNIEYLNTSSTRIFVDLLLKLSKLKGKENQLNVVWHYDSEDDDAKELGEDLESASNIPFSYISINQN